MVDLNYLKVKQLFLIIIFFLLTSKSFSENLKFQKLVNLNDPWGSSFISNNKLIITEKGGKIKIVDQKTEQRGDR